jgi:hypothetical protein
VDFIAKPGGTISLTVVGVARRTSARPHQHADREGASLTEQGAQATFGRCRGLHRPGGTPLRPIQKVKAAHKLACSATGGTDAGRAGLAQLRREPPHPAGPSPPQRSKAWPRRRR